MIKIKMQLVGRSKRMYQGEKFTFEGNDISPTQDKNRDSFGALELTIYRSSELSELEFGRGYEVTLTPIEE